MLIIIIDIFCKDVRIYINFYSFDYALKPLKAVEKMIKEAKQEYQQAKNISDREKAIAAWQMVIN